MTKVVSNLKSLSHEALVRLMESMPAAAVVVDGEALYCNRATEHLTGYAESEITTFGEWLKKLFGSADEEMRALYEQVKAAGFTVRRELQIRCKDGSIRTVEIAASGCEQVFCVLHDVTERTRAVAAVKDFEKIFNLFLDYSPIYIFFKDEQIRAIKLSRNFEELLGKPMNELLGRTMDDLFPSELAKSMIADDEKILRESVPIQVEETLNGRIYSTLKFPIIQEGHPPLLAGFAMDITLQKQAEEEILRLNSELEQRVQTRTAQLQEAFREQEAFNYSVSHDLRAPLRHINSFSAMLQEEFSDLLPEKAHAYLERIEKASCRMGELIDDLLQLSRVSRAEMCQEPVNLSDIAMHVTEMLQGTRPDRAVEYVIADGIVARGDPTLLRLALENLLGNAWKYTEQQPSARIEFGRRNDDGQDVYFVKDNGAGFDMAYADKLFHPFQRLHGQEFEGTGIGLATVRRIVERHNGRVWGEGKEGEGAIFYFSLGKCLENEIT